MPETLWRGRPTPKLRLDVYRKSNFACAQCGLLFPVPDEYDGRSALYVDTINRRGKEVCYQLELDHIVSYQRGGKYVRDNLQALCTACNARKGGRP